MSTASQTTSQRRPALIPPDLHLSPEDERSILLRIGNLQLDAPGSQQPPSTHKSSLEICSFNQASNQTAEVLTPGNTKLATSKPGKKRKAGTTAEQHHELSYIGEEDLGSEFYQQNLCEIGARCTSCTAPPGPTQLSTNIPATDRSCHGFDYESLSPKDLTECLSTDVRFRSTSPARL
jgi:hypothetical protein